ncbi:SRPBCC family protein [Marinoscillum furvescens]|uniref:Polyketide cyclase/dehydrase/lipid transport protein n=1 Tax=Marinoscillum furvescens DSM 4134 TaxID=1122208 RepID=A0A3D9L1T0_MARFU|nr:SRPBCC family protein [Marinoscillum furvescens]RED97057.1 polyketide cyclase/dehydrase/lipid transport protein [Marinoscillum furvescens DSM 4134]
MSNPVHLQVSKTISAPLNKVWHTVALGFGNVADYNPAIASSHLESDTTSGVGMIRHCNFPKSGYIKEEIIDWQELKAFKLRFIESSVPMATLESKFTFEEEEGATRVVQDFWFRMKAPIGWLSPLMKGKMKQTLITGLEGLQKHLSN